MPISKANSQISSLADWRVKAPPKAAQQWVDGRSAKEVARAWLDGGGLTMPAEVVRCLSSHPSFGEVISWDAEPEAKLRFDDFPGEPRNSDLLVDVTDNQGGYVLAVEAKADEPYGETVAATFSAALERRIANPKSRGITRIEQLAGTLFPGWEKGMPKALDLRYQLLTACAGAVAEASRRDHSRAVMLVHEFVTSTTQDRKHSRNTADLAAFLTRMSGTPISSIEDGKLYGPFSTESRKNIKLFVGKVSRDLRLQ